MATRCQLLISHWLIPGILATLLLCSVALLSFGSLWMYAPSTDWIGVLQDDSLHNIIAFSFTQAFLSALLSLSPAIPLARALYRRCFPGRQLFLRICAMTMVLPVLVAIFGLLTVYGRMGWLAQFCRWIGMPYNFSLYGLQGILLAHVFFNLPMATRLILQALESIPTEQRQLSAQLNIYGWNHFLLLEWPCLYRQLLPIGGLIFILSFSSFSTVLTLGGGPKTTIIELAIFQTLSYDYDLGRAALLAIIQLGCCLILVLFSQRFSKAIPTNYPQYQSWQDPHDSALARCWDLLMIIFSFLLLVPPLLAVIVSGLQGGLLSIFRKTAFWQATFTSIRIALSAGMLCIILTIMLLWSSRELRLRQRFLSAQFIDSSGMLILSIPSIVLATSFFLLFNATIGLPDTPDMLVIFINALIAIPYALRVLECPMHDIAARYSNLCNSLGIIGWNRLRLIELRLLRQPLTQALAFACVLSVGDFGAVALFGSADFRTLPFYLYQQIGTYRSADSAVTALLLLLLCLLLFTLIEKSADYYVNNK